jgi:hypothetical protein
MSLIKKVMITEKVTEVEFPDVDGFFVDICYISRERMLKLRQQALEAKFNRHTRQREETVNMEKFNELYVEAVIKGWRGLTYKVLAVLLPVAYDEADANKEIPYSKEDAVELLKNSSIFDQFISDAVNNFENFEKDRKEEEIKN